MRDGKLLMELDKVDPVRGPQGGEWELPGGGLDFGEEAREALRREVQEEMGLEVTYISEKPIYFWTAKRLRRRGMEWHWVFIIAYQFEVKDLNFTPTPECAEIKFFSKEELGSVRLSDQMEPLKNIFNAADFT